MTIKRFSVLSVAIIVLAIMMVFFLQYEDASGARPFLTATCCPTLPPDATNTPIPSATRTPLPYTSTPTPIGEWITRTPTPIGDYATPTPLSIEK